MTAKLLDGKKISEEILKDIKSEVGKLENKPCLAIVVIGNDHASLIYMEEQQSACASVGINTDIVKMSDSVTKEEVLDKIRELNKNNDIHGIIVEMPLPENLDQQKIVDEISPLKDVDCLTSTNLGKFFAGKECFMPATPRAIMRLIEEEVPDVKGREITVIGQSNIVGKPLTYLLVNKFATVTVCHIYTRDLKKHTKDAEIIVSATGKSHLVTADMVKDGAIIIDVGINKLKSGKIVGDVAFDEVSEKAEAITPVPGGVGPMTVAMLLENVLKAYKLNNSRI